MKFGFKTPYWYETPCLWIRYGSLTQSRRKFLKTRGERESSDTIPFAGEVHDIWQGEGCEQGDALSPALFSLGLHDALEEAQQNLPEGDFLVAYLDDVYVCTTRENAKTAFDTVARHIQSHAGIKTHLGKT